MSDMVSFQRHIFRHGGPSTEKVATHSYQHNPPRQNNCGCCCVFSRGGDKNEQINGFLVGVAENSVRVAKKTVDFPEKTVDVS